MSQLVEGTFPDFRQIIPKSHNTRIVVNTADLGKAVRMAAILPATPPTSCGYRPSLTATRASAG